MKSNPITITTFDEYCVFSIPGWDTTIAYNSFNRYKFEYWDTQQKLSSNNIKIFLSKIYKHYNHL